jgi:valyl-tRNA synthetase
MRGATLDLVDVFPDRGVSVEEWLGLLGARKGPAQSGGADAVRLCLCMGEKNLEGKSATRVATRFLDPLEQVFLKVVAQAASAPDRKAADKLQKLATRIGAALDNEDVRAAAKELYKLPGEVQDLPGMIVVARMAAPFTPFIAERIYRHIRPKGPVSVHLTRWPFSEY